MLLRSASMPIMKSSVKQPSPVSLMGSASYNSWSPVSNSIKKISSEREGENMLLRSTSAPTLKSLVRDTSPEALPSNLVSPVLDESMVVGMDEECSALAGGGSGVGGGGGGGDGAGHGFDSTDDYYQKMIKTNPGNAVLLGKYATFLKEVRGDLVKSEVYCERAILANGNDGNVFALYGDLIWHAHLDASRAQYYSDQALQAAPQDCNVLASYARLLWDAEEEEEEEDLGISEAVRRRR